MTPWKPPRIRIGLPLTILLHLLALLVLSAPPVRQQATAPHARQPAIQWLLAPARQAKPAVLKPAPLPPAQRSAPAAPPPAKAVPAASAQVSLLPAPPVPPRQETPAAPPDDPFAARPAPDAASIMRQPRHDIGKIDQELRKQFPAPAPAPPSDSKQARLERGIQAAHEAVMPKWYEAATTEEITPANSLNRIYKVRTALGAYCITINQEGRKRYTNCPQ